MTEGVGSRVPRLVARTKTARAAARERTVASSGPARVIRAPPRRVPRRPTPPPSDRPPGRRVTSLSARWGIAVLGLTSATIVASEVLLTRLLSVCTWYGLAYLVLSIAMLGITVGALSAARAHTDGRPLAPWVADRMVALSLGLAAAPLVISSVPLVFLPDLTALASVLVAIVAA